MSTAEVTHIHFIGIGGVGMSGIARVAHLQGISVSGSDLKASKYTDELQKIGIPVYVGHDACNIPEGNPVVVVSTAILPNNVELIEAKERGLTIWHRAQMLAYLGRDLKTLAVAGTHGKTTSSSMLASVLNKVGVSPTYLVGGMISEYGTNACCGQGDYYVVEADESDKSFTYLSPYVVMATNVEADHLDHYKDVEEIHDKFLEFFNLVPQEEGLLVVCGEDEQLLELAKRSGRRFVSYGTTEACDYRVDKYRVSGIGSGFSIMLPNGEELGVHLAQNPGIHNALNAAGVIAICDFLGVDLEAVADALGSFTGVHRRFDLVGRIKGVTVVDDYAHHPTEIAATIKAARALDFKRIVVLFQPHRYSRISLFADVLRDEFACAFDQADELFFTNVFSAGEAPVPGVTGQTFLNVVLEHEGAPRAHYLPKRILVVEEVAQILQEGDLLITMGAGDVTSFGPQIIDYLREKM